MTTRANPYGAATTLVVWENSQFATVGFLSDRHAVDILFTVSFFVCPQIVL